MRTWALLELSFCCGPSSPVQVRSIVQLMLAEVKARCLSERRLQLEVTDATLAKICEEGYDRSYGARPLRRKVTALVEDALSEYILVGGYHENDSLVVDIDAAGEVVVVHQPNVEVRKKQSQRGN